MSARAPFVAVDGESLIADQYNLIGCSDGRVKIRTVEGGLTTRECLEFLLNTPRPAILVCFGLGYDVNNWLRHLPRTVLQRLWKDKVCYWQDYRLEWMPMRWFGVRHPDGRRAVVNEVFGFYQSSFVRALEAWGIGAPAEIERMKQARGTFTVSQTEAVQKYCLHECDLLVELMEQLREACDEAGLTPHRWIGAGSIASALLSRQGMADHHSYDLDIGTEQVVGDAVLGAYFAGRIELMRQGVFHRVKTADLRSAYPAAARQLPSLDGAKLVRRKRFDPDKHGVWRVRWDCHANGARGEGNGGGQLTGLLAPFPVRQKMRIHWPLAGEGFYHGVEVAAAIAAGFPVEVLEGWVLRESGERPFGWIESIYQERKRMKAEGRAAEKMVKLGLNSVYGKLAQGFGYKGRPRWQNYFWAGYITAATRARILQFASRSAGLLMIATDGIFATAPAGLGRARGLGSWEGGEVEQLFTAQAGVYQGITADGEILKSRGFFASEVDYDELRAGYELEGPNYIHHYQSTRFIGLGVALMRKDFTLWRNWNRETRSLILAPERKGVDGEGVLTPPPGPLVSEPYQPKVDLIEGRSLDQMQGQDQPLREAM